MDTNRIEQNIRRLFLRPPPLLITLLVVAALATAFALSRSDALAQEENKPPYAPSEIVVTPKDGQIHAYWPAPEGATKYHVTYSSDNHVSWTLGFYEENRTQIAIPNTDNTKSYIVAVRAGNQYGWSHWLNSIPTKPYTPPLSSPTGLTVKRSCDGYLTFSWSPTSEATGYDAKLRYSVNDNWKGLFYNTTHTHWTVKTTSDDQDYQVAVRARNASGESAWTLSTFVSYPFCTPPANVRATTSMVSGNSTGDIIIKWDKDSANGITYNVNIKAQYGPWTRVITGTTAGQVTVKDDVARTYTVSVQATDGQNSTAWTESTVSAWLIPYNIGNSTASLYLTGHSGKWSYREDDLVENCWTATGNSLAFGGLSPQKEYTYEAYSGQGCAAANKIAEGSFTTQ